MTTLAAAVDEVAAAVLGLRAKRGEADLGDEVVRLRPSDAELAGLARWRLTGVYREFLKGHSSHDFVDAGLKCGARDVWISAATNVAELTSLYAQSSGWRASWVVCGLDERGCYVAEMNGGVDGPVLYVPDGGQAVVVAPGFVEFLRLVARDSSDRVVRTGAQPVAAGARLGAQVQRDDRVAFIVPVLMAVMAAMLLAWMRWG